MTTTAQIKTTLNRFIFIGKGWDESEPEREIASFGETQEQANENISGGAERWKYVRTEPVPYKLAGIVSEICDALPGEWSATPDSNEHPETGWTLASGDLRLHFSPPGYYNKGAFRVSLFAGRNKGRWYVEVYDEKNNRVTYPSINVSESKSGAQIAKDIARRLIPDAVRVNALVKAAIAKENTFEENRLAALKTVCAALNIPVATSRHSNEAKFSGYSPCNWKVNSGDSVTLKIDCKPGQVAAIVTAMK